MPGGSVMRLSNWRLITFVPARTRAGLSDRFRIHDLRHTAASPVSRRAARPRCCKRSWAHASITTTLDLYGHLYPGEMDRYADRLDEAARQGDAAKMRPDKGHRRNRSGEVRVLSWGNSGALGGTRTPNLLIRRSVPRVRPVRQNPYSQVRILPGVWHRRHSPVPSGQSVRNCGRPLPFTATTTGSTAAR